jgi:hypothetical protein
MGKKTTDCESSFIVSRPMGIFNVIIQNTDLMLPLNYKSSGARTRNALCVLGTIPAKPSSLYISCCGWSKIRVA